MQILNWPHTLQQTIAKLWLKAISSASLQNWLCCNRVALNFRHSSPYTVLNVSFNKVPKQFPVNTDRENVFQRSILCKKLQSCVHVSWDRPPSFYGSTWGPPWPTPVTWAEAADICITSSMPPAVCTPGLAAGQQHQSRGVCLLPMCHGCLSSDVTGPAV